MQETASHIRILVRDGDDLIDRFEFDGQVIRVGSGSDCDIRIPDRRLLDEQATLRPGDDGIWTLESIDVGNTVQVNGRSINGTVKIHHHDEITIFGYTLAIYNDATKPSLISRKRAQETLIATGNGATMHPLPDGTIVYKPGGELTLAGETPTRFTTFCTGLYKCGDIPKLIDHLADNLLKLFDCRFIYIGARRQDVGDLEFVKGQLTGGKALDESPLQELLVNRCLDLGQHLFMPQSPADGIGSAIAIPLSNNLGELGVIYIDRAAAVAPFQTSDLHELTMLAKLSADHLESLISNQVSIQTAAKAGELSFLREIQTRLDPAKIPEFPGLQMAAYCKPGQTSGGDVFDIMKLGNGLGGIFIGNVMSDPTRTGMAMIEARTAFRSACMHADAPNVFLRAINWLLTEDPQSAALHGAVILINPATGQMQFSTAGKIGAVIIDHIGESRDLVNHDAPPAGVTPNFAYMSANDCLKNDETLAIFTNGCTTVTNDTGEPLGEEALMESLRDGFGQSARIALDELIQDQAAFFKQGQQSADASIILFHKTAATG